MDQIVILRGAERVRKRPAVIFGSDDLTGVKNAVYMLLDALLRECKKGYGDLLAVTVHEDDSIEVRKNGRGLFFGNGDAIWQELFCALFPADYIFDAPKRSAFEEPDGDGEEISEALDFCAVQCASEYMDVRSVRDGVEYTLHFEKGENVGGLSRTPVNKPDELCIRFKPDPLVFTATALPAQWFREKLQMAAIALPGVKLFFGAEQFSYQKPADYLTGAFCFTAQLTARGQERYNKPCYTAQLNVALCFKKEGGFVRCIHNMQECTHGGTHLDALIDKIWRFVQWEVDSRLTKKAMLRHLQLLVITDAPVTVWANATRTSIQNILLRDMSEDILADQFRSYLKEHSETLKKLLK